MNIEKLVASYFDKKRSESVKLSRRQTQPSATKKHYQPENLSFQPTVHHIPKSLYRVTTKTECSREDIVERLYCDKRSVEGMRTVQKLEQEDKQFKETCTFHPETNPHSKRILKTECEQDRATNPFERLYAQGLNKKILSQSLNYSLQRKQNYPFQPETNYRTILNQQICNMKPIYERLPEIIEEKRERMKQLQEQVNNCQIKDKPEINGISQKIVSCKDQFKKNILERVSIYMQEKKIKNQQSAAEFQRYQMRECTFKPEINSTIQVSTSFMSRQDQYLRKLEDKLSSRVVASSFHPQINKISEILMREEREAETMEDKIERLNNDCVKRDKIQQLERQLYQQCTFTPQINLISKCLAAQHVSHKCNHAPQEEAYQFKPKINKVSEQLAKQAKLKKSESADFRQSKRDNNLKHIKMEMEYQELKECTFKPKVNSFKPKATIGLEDVKGFNAFARKIEKINKIKEDEKELRDKLFHKQKNYKTRKSTTPVEFKLSEGYNTKQAIKQEIREKFEKQCTFKPQIISFR